MSWTRTAIAMVVVSMVLLRWADVYGPAVLLLIGLTTAAAVYVVLSNRAAYDREVAGIEEERVAPAAGRVLVTTVSVVLLGIGAIVLVAAH